jgi:hypothetical protein
VIVDQPRQNRRPTEIDDLRARRNSRLDLRARSNSYYSLTLDEHGNIVLHDIGMSVDQVSGADAIRARNGLRGVLRLREEWKREQECQCSGGHLRIRDG